MHEASCFLAGFFGVVLVLFVLLLGCWFTKATRRDDGD